MGIFDKIKSTNVTVETKKDTTNTATGGFTFAGGVHPVKLKTMYFDKSRFEGDNTILVGLDCLVYVDGAERKFNDQLRISNRDGELEYKSKDGKNLTTAGYKLVDAICKLGLGKKLTELTDVETKEIEVFGRREEKEVIMDLRDVKVRMGFILETVDKREQIGDKWLPTGETKTRNVIHTIFDYESEKTLYEVQENLEASFVNTFNEKFKDKEINNAKGKAGVKSGTPAKSDSKVSF